MRRVCFLDVDGVLNSERFFERTGRQDRFGVGSDRLDPEALARLDRVLEATGAEVIVCSSWRYAVSPRELAQMMAEVGFKHPERVVGQTEHSAHESDTPRGDEVRDWLAMERERCEVEPEREPVTSYCIIDDDDEFDGEQQDYYIQTDREVGLTDHDARRAIAILQGGA